MQAIIYSVSRGTEFSKTWDDENSVRRERREIALLILRLPMRLNLKAGK
jgi:hypothetical protein